MKKPIATAIVILIAMTSAFSVFCALINSKNARVLASSAAATPQRAPSSPISFDKF